MDVPVVTEDFYDRQETLGSLSNGATLCIRGKSQKDWQAVLREVDIVIGD